MHRYWLDAEVPPTVGAAVTLAPDESAHLARVLRMRAGDAVELIAAERLFAAEIILSDAQASTVRIVAEKPSTESAVRLTLVQGLPKMDKLELIVQKATELGAWEVLPVAMERSVTRLDGKEEKKRERFSRIALSAAKQSGRAHVPAVLPACDFGQALEWLRTQAFDAVFVAWEDEGALRLSTAIATLLAQKATPQAIALVVGPEGGITEAEIERFKSLGACCVTLGRRILRTETAGLCALAVTLTVLGEM